MFNARPPAIIPKGQGAHLSVIEYKPHYAKSFLCPLIFLFEICLHKSKLRYNDSCKRNSIQRGDKMAVSTVNFDYKCGILEGYATRTGNDFSWFKGDSRVDVSCDGTDLAELAVPVGATAVQVKKIIKDSRYV